VPSIAARRKPDASAFAFFELVTKLELGQRLIL
jgi:hypothetical protein